MIFRNLDANHDWTFGSGRGNYISGDAAIGLNVDTRLLSWLNDCFFDMGAGIDWLNRLGSKNQQNLLNMDLRRVISQSFGVTGINDFSYNVSGDRLFTAKYDIITINSQSYKSSLLQNLNVTQ